MFEFLLSLFRKKKSKREVAKDFANETSEPVWPRDVKRPQMPPVRNPRSATPPPPKFSSAPPPPRSASSSSRPADRSGRDDYLMNPAHPLSPLNPMNQTDTRRDEPECAPVRSHSEHRHTSRSDDDYTPSRSHSSCSSSYSSYGGDSSSSSSSSCDSSSSSSSSSSCD